ncbi:MAG: transaldolase family protein, partial [Mucinivorans sp.]
MKFFIDTASLDQIRQGAALGVIDGVTTNPSLMAKEGVKGDEAIRAHYQEICKIVDGDISAEVLSTTFDEMIIEGQSLAALHKNIVVKVPCTLDGIKAIKWFTDHNIRTNCTLVFAVGQAVLAAKAGAAYVSPFVGRLDDISSNGVALVAEIVDVFRTYGYKTQVLAASIRHTQHIIDCMSVGA